jgi:hypothetical protein
MPSVAIEMGSRAMKPVEVKATAPGVDKTLRYGVSIPAL